MQNVNAIDAVDYNPNHFNEKGKSQVKSIDEMVRMQCLVDNIPSILSTDDELAKIASTWESLQGHLIQKENKFLNQYSNLCYDFTKRKCLSQTKQSEEALKEERNEGSKMVMQLKAMHEIKTHLIEGRFDNKLGDTRCLILNPSITVYFKFDKAEVKSVEVRKNGKIVPNTKKQDFFKFIQEIKDDELYEK